MRRDKGKYRLDIDRTRLSVGLGYDRKDHIARIRTELGQGNEYDRIGIGQG